MIQQETQNKGGKGKRSREIKDTLPTPGAAEQSNIKEVIGEAGYCNPGILIKPSSRKKVAGIVPGVLVR